MNKTIIDEPVLDEKIWLAWLHKNKLQQQATARRLKWLASVGFVAAALGSAFYFGLR